MNEFKNEKKSNLHKLVENQATKIHKKVVNDISDIMNVDIDTAKLYKSVLWKNVTNNNKSLSNLDKSLKMQSMTTKENLSKINIQEVKKNIKK